MTLPAGSRLGPYEILSAVGAGGMGEVYKARDVRLDRTVAVKVLPASLSENPAFRQRFEREAKAISQLSHPHICTVHDVGNEDGVEYLVMEFLEGETLADRIARGPLPLDQVLRYGIEIADALEKAHRHGVVHRDLKPGNVMLTKSGVKLVDFGLAKLDLPAPGSVAASLSDVLTQGDMNLSAQGTIVGTLHYMSPEQLEGGEADGRTDIFGLGLLLFEMTTGKKAFTGKSPASLMAAILHTEPEPISSFQPTVPPALDRIVRTCLAKDPNDRFQTAHDVRLQLQWIVEGGSGVGLPAPVAAKRKSREKLAWALVPVAALAAAAATLLVIRLTSEAPRIVRSSLLSPEKSSFAFDFGPMALSPDGRRVAFVANSSGINRLWVQPLSGVSAQPLAGTDGASNPFWSPDSRFLGFFANRKLNKIEASGGPPQTLADASLGRGGSWNRDGVILFVPNSRDVVHRVSASGGSPSPVTKLDAGASEVSHRWPVFLPDGRRFLYLAQNGRGIGEKNAIYAASLDGGERKLLFNANTNVAYTAPGHLLFYRERTLLARPFDPKSLRFTDEAFPVAEDVKYFATFAQAVFAVSDHGLLAYQTGEAEGRPSSPGSTVPASRRAPSVPRGVIPPRGCRATGNELPSGYWILSRWETSGFTISNGTRRLASPSIHRTSSGRSGLATTPGCFSQRPGRTRETSTRGIPRARRRRSRSSLRTLSKWLWTGRRMDEFSCSRWTTRGRPLRWTSGRTRWPTARRRRFSRPRLTRSSAASPRTGVGSPTFRTSPARRRFTSCRFPDRAASGRSRRPAAARRTGRGAEVKSSIRHRGTRSWRSKCGRRPPFRRGSRQPCSRPTFGRRREGSSTSRPTANASSST